MLLGVRAACRQASACVCAWQVVANAWAVCVYVLNGAKCGEQGCMRSVANAGSSLFPFLFLFLPSFLLFSLCLLPSSSVFSLPALPFPPDGYFIMKKEETCLEIDIRYLGDDEDHD